MTPAFLFTIYSGTTAREQIALEIGPDPLFLYEDNNKRPGRDGSPRFTGVNPTDGK